MRRAILLVSLTFSVPAPALPLHFQRIADTTTAIPGGSGTFRNVAYASFEAGRVVFTGFGDSSQVGVYTSTGGAIARVADASTPVPGAGGDTFGFPGHGIADGDSVAFKASSAAGGVGLYRWTAATGSTALIVDGTTAVPGGSGTFSDISHWDTHDGQVAFEGMGGSSQEGIYRAGPGGVEVVADRNTAMPSHTADFEYFGGVSLRDGAVSFRGHDSSGHYGVYSDRNGTVERVADRGMTAPKGRRFDFFDWEPGLSGGDVAFHAGMVDPTQYGIFLDDGSGIETIADTLTSIPGGSGRFESFSNPSVEGGRVLFRGMGPDFQDGIYLSAFGGLHEVIASGDELDGLIVDFVNITTSSLDGAQFALVVTFHRPPGSGFSTPTPEVVYLVTIPEPGTGALLGVGLAGLIGRRRQSGA